MRGSRVDRAFYRRTNTQRIFVVSRIPDKDPSYDRWYANASPPPRRPWSDPSVCLLPVPKVIYQKHCYRLRTAIAADRVIPPRKAVTQLSILLCLVSGIVYSWNHVSSSDFQWSAERKSLMHCRCPANRFTVATYHMLRADIRVQNWQFIYPRIFSSSVSTRIAYQAWDTLLKKCRLDWGAHHSITVEDAIMPLRTDSLWRRRPEISRDPRGFHFTRSAANAKFIHIARWWCTSCSSFFGFIRRWIFSYLTLCTSRSYSFNNSVSLRHLSSMASLRWNPTSGLCVSNQRRLLW